MITANEKVKLQLPIMVDGAEVKELIIRRPKVRDVKIAEASGGDDMERSITLIANLTNLTPDQVEDLDMGTDFITLRGIVQRFLGIDQD